eukprot:COSAG03_NODE_16_length_21807_cov_27.080247_16_plen_115_part_00
MSGSATIPPCGMIAAAASGIGRRGAGKRPVSAPAPAPRSGRSIRLTRRAAGQIDGAKHINCNLVSFVSKGHLHLAFKSVQPLGTSARQGHPARVLNRSCALVLVLALRSPSAAF